MNGIVTWLNKKLDIPKGLYYILLLAFVLRVIWLPQNLFFGFEQGRDFLEVSKIVHLEDFRLIGANTDIDGIFHGAFYYYFISPIFFISGGNPLTITVFLIFLNVCGIYFLYRAVEKLFDKRVALFSSLFLAISYSSVIYSRWLSNPNLIPFFTCILFYSLIKTRDDKKFLYIGALSWSIIFHLSLATATTLVLPILFFLFTYKIKINSKSVFIILIVLLLVFSPYIIFDLRNNNILINSLLKYIQVSGSEKNYLAAFYLFLTEYVDNIMPTSRNIAFLFLGISFFSLGNIFMKKEVRVILGFIFLPILLYFVLGMVPIRHVFIAYPIFLSIFMAIIVLNLAKRRTYLAILVLLFIISSNIWHIMSVLPESKGNFLQRSQRTYLGDQKKALDYIYTHAQGQPFSYDYFSVPWWKSEAWDYLFLWYGKNKYGYLPLKKEKSQIFYSVWEPDETTPIYKDNWYGELNSVSNIIETEAFGDLGVEKREWKQKK